MLTHCRVLEPGAGRSPEPAALLSAMALDLAESAIAAQQSHLGVERAVKADVTTWLSAEPFDAIYDQTCLCAPPPPLWPAYEAQLRQWLRLGGRLFILFMQTGGSAGPPFVCSIREMRLLFRTWNGRIR